MKLPFDKIYCLHLAEAVDRYENILSEFDKVGITSQVEIWWTCKHPISVTIGDNLKEIHSPYYDCKRKKDVNVYAGVFNCAFEHYTIIKQAYLRGFNNILIFEDDVKFTDDLEKLQDIMNNLPQDYDMLKFSHDAWKSNVSFKDFPIMYKYWTKENFRGKDTSTCAYALSRKGMEKIVNWYESSFGIIDVSLANVLSENTYCLVEPAIYADPNYKSYIIKENNGRF